MKKITFLIVLIANSMFLSAQIFSEDFDDETINSFTYENWVAIDADGDGRYFEVFDADSNLVDLNDDGTFDVPMNWSLSGMAVDSDSWEEGTGALTPDNFLIIQIITSLFYFYLTWLQRLLSIPPLPNHLLLRSFSVLSSSV